MRLLKNHHKQIYYSASICDDCQHGSSMSRRKVLDDCISRQSFADWQEASVYRPAGKEESKVAIKSAQEVETMR